MTAVLHSSIASSAPVASVPTVLAAAPSATTHRSDARQATADRGVVLLRRMADAGAAADDRSAARDELLENYLPLAEQLARHQEYAASFEEAR